MTDILTSELTNDEQTEYEEIALRMMVAMVGGQPAHVLNAEDAAYAAFGAASEFIKERKRLRDKD